MSRVSRRQLLKLGGLLGVGAAGTLLEPRVVLGRTPPGLARKALKNDPPHAEPEPINLTPEPEPTTEPGPALVYRALDTDFGPNGVQPQAWFDEARAAGYDGFITTLHTYWNGEPQMWGSSDVAFERALAAGMWIAAYGRPVTHWREALVHLSAGTRSELKFFALDVEPEPFGNLPLRHEYVEGVREFGVRPIVYSGWGMWGDVMGSDSDDFSHLPLWDFAGDRFDWPETLTEAPLVEYAGWNRPGNFRIGWQVQMQQPATFNGISIDRDLFDRSFIDAG